MQRWRYTGPQCAESVLQGRLGPAEEKTEEGQGRTGNGGTRPQGASLDPPRRSSLHSKENRDCTRSEGNTERFVF